MKNKAVIALLGIAAGIINGFFGAGGGMVLVPLLESIENKNGEKMSPKTAHATTVFIVLFLSAVSVCFYIFGNGLEIASALPFALGGVLGALPGAFFLKKIDPALLKRIFGGFLVFAAVKMLLGAI
ncbi:MAG: sulfite exporter TauE/SafE family protein [Clostridia bacterium]|nr:sulfite exporter TauE/SafE family protein [Clostridia bacterium]MBR2327121.1 sulfite exporter TauE/SafE family protein [Clostridia bacterium]